MTTTEKIIDNWHTQYLKENPDKVGNYNTNDILEWLAGGNHIAPTFEHKSIVAMTSAERSEYQRKLFNKIVGIQSTLPAIAAPIQNDLESCIDDGIITRDDIRAGILKMHDQYTVYIDDLSKIMRDVNKLLLYYCVD